MTVDMPPALRFLIADDNEIAAKTFGWMVEALGHTSQVVFDGPSAITAAEASLPDVLMLDISLPGMTGYEICQKLRAHPGLEKSLFIAQTGWSSPEHKEQSKQAGFDYHLVKPVTVEHLQDVLNGLIRKQVTRSL